MNEVNSNTVYKQSSRAVTMANPAYTRAAIGDLAPFPEELSPSYLLAQHQFKRKLKDKFRLMLAAGKEIIEQGVSEQLLGSLVPMSEDELCTAKTVLDNYSQERERRALVGALLTSSQSDNVTDSQLDKKYVHSISMLNQLVTLLKQESLKFDSYVDVAEKASADPAHSFSQQQLMNGMLEVLNVLPAFRSVREKVIDKTTVEEEAVQSHFSLFGQMEKFLKEKQGSIDDRTIAKYKASFTLLKEIFPQDSDVRVWKKQRVQQVKAKLTESKPSPKTRNMYLSNYRTLFAWIIDNTDADISNPFSNTAFSKSKGKSKQPKRRSFTDHEVQALLTYKPQHGSEAKGYRRDANWYTKVCLYSSMRLNELSALPLANIKPIDDIWCFDLRGLNLKNESSERVIPIAQYLLDQGILEYVKMLEKEKEKYFCPQIRHGKTKPSSAGWGDPISRWFNRSVLKNIGINKDEELEKGLLICFHCTRRTFISTCVNNGEEKYLVKRLAGHSVDDDITLSVYSDMDKIGLKLLKDVIDRNLKWHESESR